MSRGILVAIPTMDGTISVQTSLSLYREQMEAAVRGWRLVPMYQMGNSIIHRARNFFLSELIALNFDDMVFVDSDVGWEPGALCRLCEYPVDIVGGSYRIKRDEEEYRIRWLDKAEIWSTREGGLIDNDRESALIEVDGVPTGFLRISRNAAMSMAEAYQQDSYSEPECTAEQAFRVFQYLFENGQEMGEDFSFCILARRAGIKVWLAPNIHMTHTGTKVFAGHIGHWLKSRTA